ncbi:MAG: crotonase/enoyl-CoA hydratase family protein [Woeseiaceae bacterium]
MSERVKISIDGHVAAVTLNRPDKHNAVDLKMFAALAAAGEQLATNRSVRAIVLRGAGKSFCAGVDLSIFQQGDGTLGPEMMAPGETSPANFFQRAATIWREVPVPVISALHGTVFGAGLQIALGADLRFASSDCRMSVMEIKWGIIPDMAISTTLPRIMPLDKIKELAWTGRIVSGEEALDLGLVTALHADPFAAAIETAGLIAGRSPAAVRAIKRLFDESATMDVSKALQLEAELQLALLGSADQAEAVMANLEKRDPNFEG